MIRFERVPEPGDFDRSARVPGNAWLAANPGDGRPRDYRTPFKGALAKGFRNLCAYSAMYEPVGTVDHFVSCDEDRWQAYEWDNYRYCAAWINSSKGNVPAGDLLDPFEIENGWFELHLPSLQLRVSDAIPEEIRERAEYVLVRLHLRNDERVMRQRREWYRMYQCGELSQDGLRRKAPPIAAAIGEHGVAERAGGPARFNSPAGPSHGNIHWRTIRTVPGFPRPRVAALRHRSGQAPPRCFQLKCIRPSLDAATGTRMLWEAALSDRGVGASIARKEDDRFLMGTGQFTPDVQLPGMWHAAFNRAPIAHGRLLSVTAPAGAEGQVFAAADMADIKPIRSTASFPGFKPSDFPVLARDKVRYAGEQVAIAVAPTRAEAEDIADAIQVEYEELPAVVDLNDGREPSAALVHDGWADNVVCETGFENGDLDAAREAAAHTVHRRFRMARQTPFPMEGRGTLAHYDSRLDELVVWMSHQLPHPMQRGIAHFLDLEINKVRVICPDVGGGFGLKTHLDGETMAVCWTSLRLGRPVKWIQDRLEHLTCDADCREHQYTMTAHTDAVGKILGMEVECVVDAGAYSPWPWPVGVEAATGVGNLQGPYTVDALKGRSVTVCTNKPPSQPFRGVARPGACFTDELTMDAIARTVGREPWDVRLDNLVPPEAMPYDTVTRKHLDSGDYPEAFRRCVAAIDPEAVRVRQKTPEPDGRLVGIGFACFYEQTAYGTGPFGYSAWGIQLVPGMEMATVKFTPDGGLWASVGIQSHGQGLETTLAQIAASELGIDPDRIAIRHGDTATAYAGTGTYASRSIVVAGGAVAQGCRELKPRLARIGAHLLQCDEADVAVENAEVRGPGGSVSFAEIAEAFYHHPENLPDDTDRGGLTVTAGYNDKVHGGVFGFGAHGAVVAVDPETGQIEILDYAIVDDCGTRVNPLLVKGQVIGGYAQGIGNALYEESAYDANGQPLSVTLADYHVPAAPMVPDVKYDYMESPSPYSTMGIKGVGESGAIGPVGAIGNAVNDALKGLGVEIAETPITPRRVFDAIERGREP